MNKELEIKFDINTIQHLGISMYSKLPAVISELVSNAWDADANTVNIIMDDRDPDHKKITVKDDGIGMSLEDINSSFLVIGRNRRTAEKTDRSAKNRPVIGKKGLGKLSIFGVTEIIHIRTVSNNVATEFELNLKKMLESGEVYHPPIIDYNENSKEANGTTIVLFNVKRKTKYNIDTIARDLSKRFSIFSNSFEVNLQYNDQSSFAINPALKFENIDIEYDWKIPHGIPDNGYPYYGKLGGYLFSAKKPVPPDLRGIALLSRGKLVHQNDFFGVRDVDYAHAYISGWLEVDFIDEWEKDVISTNRETLNWEDEDIQELQNYLQGIVSFLTSEWRKKRRMEKEAAIQKKSGFPISDWLSKLPEGDKKIASRIMETLLRSEELEIEKTTDLANYVRDSFEFESFKHYASEMESMEQISGEHIIKLIKDWKIIESKELYKLAIVRIEAIKKLEHYIKTNAKEVPVIHDFLKQFPWLIDPRIMNFEDEVTYSKLLKEHYPDEELETNDRRLDFLCVDFSDTFFIIELKRPKKKVSDKELDQALNYVSFLKRKLGSDGRSGKRVTATIIADSLVNVDAVEEKADSLSESGRVYVKSYYQLLSVAQKYHSEFIEKYDELQKIG